ncbi:MAG: hypothetical protein GY754_22155 [bacterium]|nr:hypothetical protein [bacterium]
MTDDMLWKIAQADYGYEKEKCFNLLKKIITTREIPARVDFIPGECLELTRWTIAQTEEEHIIRAFSSALLIILEPLSDYDCLDDENASLAVLIESMTILRESCKSTQELIVWKILTDYHETLELYLSDEEDKFYVDEITVNDFFIYALLLLMVHNREAEEDAAIIVDWNMDMEKYNNNTPPYQAQQRESWPIKIKGDETFLLGTTLFTQRHTTWKDLSRKLNLGKEYITSYEVRNKIERIADCIINNKAMRF